jgi:thioredoxin-related protein
MLSRRDFLAGSLAGAAAIHTGGRAAAEAILSDDGLYRQPWFLESFLELADDLVAAAQNAKRFAVMWELKGCPYCKETHLVNFARPDIENFVRERFDILQLNIVGAREVTDFDGEKLAEKALARKYDVRYTPTLQFFPESAAGLAGKKPRDREVARAQGYLASPHFLAMFRFVAEKAYERGTLRDFLRASG